MMILYYLYIYNITSQNATRAKWQEEDISAVFKERVWFSGNQKQLKLTMTEYFLFYFVYYIYLHEEGVVGGQQQQQQQESMPVMKKASSILSVHTASDKTNTMSIQKAVQSLLHLKRPAHANQLYVTLLQQYLEYFIPDCREVISHPQTLDNNRGLMSRSNSFSFNNASLIYSGIFECKLIEEQLRSRLSKYFGDLLIEMWLGQNDYKLSLPSMEPQLIGQTFTSVKLDNLILTRMLVRHLSGLSRFPKIIESLTEHHLTGVNTRQNPIERVYLQIYELLKFRLFRFMRLHLLFSPLDTETILFDNVRDL